MFECVGTCLACSSCDELADTAGGSDAFLCDLGEELGAHDAGLRGELTLSADLNEALYQRNRSYYLIKRNTYSLGNIDHSSLVLG